MELFISIILIPSFKDLKICRERKDFFSFHFFFITEKKKMSWEVRGKDGIKIDTIVIPILQFKKMLAYNLIIKVYIFVQLEETIFTSIP